MRNTKSGRKKAGPSQGERGFQFLRTNPRPDKPRQRGITEIRGPYYSVVGKRYLQDLLETMGAYVDSLKFGGGSFCLMPRRIVREINDLCHENEVTVSSGGFIEFVLAQGREAVRNYIRECKELGFDTIEVSTGFITMPVDDLLRLVELVQKSGLNAKLEIGVHFGAGGATPTAELEAEGTRDPSWLLSLARRFLEAGVELIMIESEGITEKGDPWRTNVPALLDNETGIEQSEVEVAR